MNFINPFYLFALSAASIPIIIHLLNLRKQKKIEFSTLFFLKEMQKTKIRNIKIKKWLLLLIRTLMIISVVFAFSRPTIKSVIPGFSLESRKSHIIMVDNSYSMEYKDENGNRLEQAKSIAMDILKGIKTEEEVCVIPISNYNGKNLYFSRDKDKLEEYIKQIKLENFNSEFTQPLTEAIKMSNSSNYPNKVIYVISDMPKSYFEFYATSVDNYEFPANAKIDDNTGMVFIPIKNKDENIGNISIDSINVNNTIMQIGSPFSVDVVVTNHSKRKVNDVILNLYLNEERVAQRKFNLSQKASEKVIIGSVFKVAGVQNLKVEIENDALDFDNYRYFNIKLPNQPKVLIIGDKVKQKYLNLALGGNDLANVNNNDKLVDLSIVAPNQIGTVDLEEFDVLILGNGPYQKNDISKITSMIRNGKSAILFSEIIESEYYDYTAGYTSNNSFMDVVFDLQLEIDGLEKVPTDNNVSFTDFNREHSMFNGLFIENTNQKLELESPKITDYNPIISNNHLIYIGSSGFLSEVTVGKGKVLYYSIGNETFWSNFPFTSLYPALMYRSVIYLSSTEQSNKEFNSPKSVHYLDGREILDIKLKIIGPDKSENYPETNVLGNSVFFDLNEFKKPGNYQIYNSNKLIDAFEINIPPNESYFYDKIEKEYISDYLEYYFEKEIPFEMIENKDNINAQITITQMGSELWKLFVIITLILAVLEMLIQKYYSKPTND